MRKWILILALMGAGCSTSPKDPSKESTEAPVVLQPKVDSRRVIKGPSEAPVTILEYGDFQCPACAVGAANLKFVLEKYGDKVRFIFKHLPLPYHPQSKPAAQAFEILRARSAAQAYDFYLAVYAEPGLLNSKTEFEKILKKFKLSSKNLEMDFRKLKLEALLESDKAEFLAFGFRGTPVFIVNGQPLEGAPSAMDFDRLISQILEKSY